MSPPSLMMTMIGRGGRLRCIGGRVVLTVIPSRHVEQREIECHLRYGTEDLILGSLFL